MATMVKYTKENNKIKFNSHLIERLLFIGQPPGIA